MELGSNTTQLNGYKRMAFKVIARALDDICPLDTLSSESEDSEPTILTAEEIEQNIKNRIQRFEESESALDREWYVMEQAAIKEAQELSNAREKALYDLSQTYNAEEVKKRVKFYENEMSQRLVKVVTDINKVRDSYLSRVEKASERGRKLPKKQHNLKLKAFQTEITEKTKKIKDRYGIIIENVRKTDNKDKVLHRIEEAKGVWDRRHARLKRKFMLREENHNHKRLENDSIRLSLNWFINDIERVSYWCTVAEIGLDLCYSGAKARLELIGRNSIELNEVAEYVKEVGEVKPNIGLTKNNMNMSELVSLASKMTKAKLSNNYT